MIKRISILFILALVLETLQLQPQFCLENCIYCLQQNTYCATCVDGYNSINGICEKDPLIPLQPAQCLPNCLKCATENPQYCMTCNQGYTSINGLCKSDTGTGGGGETIDPQCGFNCLNCYTNGKCLVCENGFLLNDLDACVKQTCEGQFCITCAQDGLCQECEYPYFNLEGSCEQSCPITYKAETSNRQCTVTTETKETRMVPKILLYMIIFITCIFCFFIGRIGYMWYQDNLDEENEYGSGSFVPVEYEVAQKQEKKQEEPGLFMKTSERLKNAFSEEDSGELGQIVKQIEIGEIHNTEFEDSNLMDDDD